jgi:DNA (cytosine-5)-methyltransferase 1
MKKEIIELFAGVGGFRVGFEKASKQWQTVWANQWEPNNTKQYAFNCYKKHFENSGGINDWTNTDINKVDSNNIPNHTLLVGGFPCQDYSVAGTQTKGIEGKKGVLWWDINRIIKDKKPSFILLENVDRLIKSPAKQRGRDFGVILSCLNNLGYGIEWRVINAEDYGLQQRRRRIFIFAFAKNTKYYNNFNLENSLFFKTFHATTDMIANINLSTDIIEVSNNFSFNFENSGYSINNKIYTTKAKPIANKSGKTLFDIMEYEVDEKYFLSPETEAKIKYLKSSKKEERETPDGFKYNYSEGAVPFPDILERPARTLLTSESSNNRSTHVVVDKKTGKLRKLTPIECERINGFDDDWTKTDMTEKFRYFCMGNALVVDLVTMIAKNLESIFDHED